MTETPLDKGREDSPRALCEFLLDTAAEPVVVADRGARILFTNRAAQELLGAGPDQINDRHVGEWFDLDPEPMRAASEAHAEGRHTLRPTVVHSRGPGGRSIPAIWHACPGQGPEAVVLVGQPAHNPETSEPGLLRNQRLESVGRLAGGVAHDLNNILAPIMMAVSLLRDRISDEASRGFLDLLQKSAERGAGLVKQVLAFSSGVNGHRLLLQPKHLVRDAERLVNETFLKAIRAQSRIGSGVHAVHGDPTELHQMLLSMCFLARAGASPGAELVLSAENATLDAHFAALQKGVEPGNYVVFQAVFPDGRPSTVETLWRVVETVARNHGGFALRDRTDGRARLAAYIPAAKLSIETAPPAAAETPTPAPGRGQGDTILVVDDEESIRDVTRQILESWNYQVLSAADGIEALAVFASNAPRIRAVITDLVMPRLDGVSTTQAIQHIRANVPVIATSGLVSDETVTQLRGVGITEILRKPYTAENLLATLERALKPPGA
jgi:two-component system, cell cycle sensor histidine kinase and response regulator CckA